jgi:GR25 family glycosyltransferase involved in LPS biosynthesis
MWHERFKRKYMINLPERTDRRQSVTAELGKLGLPCEFVDGVRGKDNPFASWFFRTILKQTGNAGPGLVGCHLAHAMIWIQAALDARLLPDDYVLIMEDDLVWCNGASNELIDSLLACVPPQATMIKFSVADWNNRVHILEQLGQVKLVAEGVYLQTGMLGGH